MGKQKTSCNKIKPIKRACLVYGIPWALATFYNQSAIKNCALLFTGHTILHRTNIHVQIDMSYTAWFVSRTCQKKFEGWKETEKIL
jgi:hypothetical protein